MSKQVNLNFVDIPIDDGSPVDQDQRKEYTARVSGFFSDIMEARIKYMIGQQMKMLQNPDNSREADLFIKANINALSLLLDWGDECLNEYMSYQDKPESET